VTAHSLIVRSGDDERVFSRPVAAQLARITLDFLDRCEREELLRPGPLRGGGEGYTLREIAEMVRIRRLQQDLGLDLAAIEVVLHMRQRMLAMLDEMTALEARMWERERQMRSEIHELRRQLARDAGFR
jgi:MerR family transcriptional regulator/heat shock protein HspR